MVVVCYNRERDELTGKWDMTMGAVAFGLLLTLDGGRSLSDVQSFALTEEEDEEGENLKQQKKARNEGIWEGTNSVLMGK